MAFTPVIFSPRNLRQPGTKAQSHVNHCLSFFGLIFVALLVVFIATTQISMTAVNPMILSASTIKELNSINDTITSLRDRRLDITEFPERTRDNGIRTRVVLFVLDGLRFDAMFTNPDFHRLLTRPDILRDSAVFKLNLPMPSISIPGWITLLTGSSPQYHGVSGNNNAQEVITDNVFRQSLNYGLRTGLSGDADWRKIFRNSIQPLSGDGTRPSSYEGDQDQGYRRGASYAHRDALAANVMFEAMLTPSIYSARNPNADWKTMDAAPLNSTEMEMTYFPYDFFLSYFCDIDSQGHSWGGTSDNYNTAITNKTRVIDLFLHKLSLIDLLDRTADGGRKWKTIVAITSDHGHVDVGGHGGTDKSVTTIPMIFFSNGSRMGEVDMPYKVDLKDREDIHRDTPYTSHDVSTSLSALLGLPVPRSSEGNFLPVVEHLITNKTRMDVHKRDLMTQKRRYLSTVARDTGVTEPLDRGTRVNDVIHDLHRVEDAARHNRIQRNSLLSALVWLIVFLLATFIAQKTTDMDLLAILPASLLPLIRKVTKRCGLKKEAKNRSAAMRKMHRASLFLSILFTGLYLSLGVAIFLISFKFYRPYPTWNWDSALFQSVYDTNVAVIFMMVPGTLLILLTHLVCATLLSFERTKRWWNDSFTGGNRGEEKERTPKWFGSLTWQYNLYTCILAASTLLAAQAYQCVYLVPILNVQFLTPDIWVARFRSVTLAFMIAPLLAYSIFMHLLYAQFFSKKYNHPKSELTKKFLNAPEVLILPPPTTPQSKLGTPSPSLRRSARGIPTASPSVHTFTQ
ncbi:hypothetical protein PROFUN_10569 [Planoprotostelium fungivorum]|uniref:Uncharacterized protein n=1 Tax=Planoprotostelium fungivorum TaxID=1890364 RepID=A0A2P6NCZ4_9EUKA|nr:hypothetical protein PROFUN_10569 [Planoprotostelium fungivorum]